MMYSPNSKTIVWTPEMTSNLILLYKNKIDQFRNPKVKKKVLFQEISQMISTSVSCSVTADECDRKWRNLKCRFISIYVKTVKIPGENIRWPYYEEMYEILKDDKRVSAALSHQASANDVTGNIISYLQTPISAKESSESLSSEDVSTSKSNNRAPYSKDFDVMRSIQLEIKNKRKCEVAKLREVLEESNNIQRRRNELIKMFIDKMS